MLTRDECAALVARIEAAGCAPAPITTGAGFVMRSDIRNNPKIVAGWDVVGANERLRRYRYERGQRPAELSGRSAAARVWSDIAAPSAARPSSEK